ncbi:hypothetical protein NT6N_39150 [Oceaniferula spumae]|uniref:TIGR02206 family membrane protein n=1 Tax=Oceaniferula spumae TaxID=2979115 RepID=A0AAT9FS65_9BACT
MLATFQHYGMTHIGVLAVLVVVTTLMIRRCRKDPESPRAKAAIALLAFLCFAAYPINQAILSAYGGSFPLDSLMPFHLCDIAAFICGFALITRRPILCELSYFWGLAGTMQGLLTPNLAHDFPSPVFFIFFLHHGVIVITALLLPLGLGWRPREGAALRAFVWVLIYAGVAFIANYLLETNFGFLMHKPDRGSLLDIMGPWPWYVLCLISLAGLFFYLLSLPFKRSLQSAVSKPKEN